MKTYSAYFLYPITILVSMSLHAQNLGSSKEALRYSLTNNAELVLHLLGGTVEKYTAAQYSNMLNNMFADSGRTKFPTETVIFFEESKENERASVIVYMDGYSFDRNGEKLESGDDIIHPYDVVPLIPYITEWHAFGGETGSRPSSTAAITGSENRRSKAGLR